MSSAMVRIVPACQAGACTEDGAKPSEAEWLMPQRQGQNSQDPNDWRFVLVCDAHARDWWGPNDPHPEVFAYRLIDMEPTD